MLVVVSGSRLLRTPVDLRDDDGMGVNHRHGLMELPDAIFRIGLAVTCAIPAGIIMDGIADVITADGISGVAAIVALPSTSRHPDDAGEAIGTYFVDDRLEELLQRLGRLLSYAVSDLHRFIGQFDGQLSGIFAHGIVA